MRKKRVTIAARILRIIHFLRTIGHLTLALPASNTPKLVSANAERNPRKAKGSERETRASLAA
jgi:hypothetical protein